MAFRATLNFQKFKVARNATYGIFFNFAKRYFTVPFLNYKPIKPQLRVFLTGHTVAMVTYYVMERTTTCSPIVGQFFDTMIVASSDKE